MWDPNTWDIRQESRYLYLSDRDSSLRALVDEEDYVWAKEFTWEFAVSRLKPGKMWSEKFYARRMLPRNGGTRRREYLHKTVLLSHRGPPPNEKYTIGDHINGDTLDCRRSNLRWATPAMNRKNIVGSKERERLLLEWAEQQQANNDDMVGLAYRGSESLLGEGPVICPSSTALDRIIRASSHPEYDNWQDTPFEYPDWPEARSY